MKKSDLFREYARVIDMCEGTGVDPLRCIKNDGVVGCLKELPAFDVEPKHYEFALAILEGKPVFKGDDVYFESGARYMWGGYDSVTDYIGNLTWTKPRTFTPNGEVLPCPARERQGTKWSFPVGAYVFHFNTEAERDRVFNTILKMLTDAKNS